MTDTKEKILAVALQLFAKDGYEAVSVSKIAEKLGITKGALYKHYENKKDIFNSIVARMSQSDHEIARKYGVPENVFDCAPDQYEKIGLKNLKNFAVSQYRFWTSDEFAADYRKMLTLEQYRNLELNKLYQDSLVRGPVLYLKDIFREMIRCGVLKENDPYQLAIEFFSPLFLLINMSDENESYVDIEKRLIKHIDFFIESHTKERENKNEIFPELQHNRRTEKRIPPTCTD